MMTQICFVIDAKMLVGRRVWLPWLQDVQSHYSDLFGIVRNWCQYFFLKVFFPSIFLWFYLLNYRGFTFIRESNFS